MNSNCKQAKVVLVPESHLNVMDKACQTNDCMVEETPSPYHAVISDSDADTDREVISDHEMSGNTAPVKIANNSYDSRIASKSNSAETPTPAQNLTSTTHQTDSRVVLEQQMLNNFSSLLNKTGSTFNLIPQVPPTTQERQIEATATANSSNKNRHSHDVTNKAPKNKHNNLWRFVLPPEYDPQDTRWTLKYRTYIIGLVELMPQSGIYVSYGELMYCQQFSKDCKSLAQRLLLEVFNRKALSVCLTIGEEAQASDNVSSNVRPGLDEHATSVLLSFVLERGFQHGWNTDLQPITRTLNSKIQEIRFKYGVMVKC